MPSMALVTLTTDFGTADGYVGAIKGVILARAPGTTVVDIAHDIRRHDVGGAAFALSQAAPWFPDGTVHVVVVDPGVGGLRMPVVVDSGRQLFVGPDNGVLSLAVPQPRAAFAITAAAFRAASPAPTFHGRDIFAVTAAQLAGGAAPDQAGDPIQLAGRLPGPGRDRAGQPGDLLRGEVIHVDSFGNLITDLPAAAVAGASAVRIAGRTIQGLSSTYSSVPVGEYLAYIGSGGTLEIAVREGDAAELLRVSRGAPV